MLRTGLLLHPGLRESHLIFSQSFLPSLAAYSLNDGKVQNPARPAESVEEQRFGPDAQRHFGIECELTLRSAAPAARGCGTLQAN
jgi:hypothetical protein